MSKKPIEENQVPGDHTPGSALKELHRFSASDDMAQTMGILFDEIAESGDQYAINSALKAAEGMAKTGPYYDQIIESKPEYAALKGATVIVMKRPKEDDSEETKALHDLFLKAWAEAVALRKEQEAAGADLENVQGKRLAEWISPTDKNTALFFSAAISRMAKDVPGQMSFIPELMNETNAIAINNGKRSRSKTGKSALLFLAYNDDNETMRQLNLKWGDNYARNLFTTLAITNLYLAGNKKVTLSQIFRAMPGRTNGSPSKYQLQELFKNVLQCISTPIYMNTQNVSERWGISKYKQIVTTVAPGKWVNERITINGALADSYLEIYDVSPFFQLARDMGQIQTVNLKMLDIEISRTETNYRVYEYLLRQVLWMQNEKSKRSNLITYADLLKNIGGGRTERVKDTCFKILEQWKAGGMISDYKETQNKEAPGIRITSKPKQLTD